MSSIVPHVMSSEGNVELINWSACPGVLCLVAVALLFVFFVMLSGAANDEPVENPPTQHDYLPFSGADDD